MAVELCVALGFVLVQFTSFSNFDHAGGATCAFFSSNSSLRVFVVIVTAMKVFVSALLLLQSFPAYFIITCHKCIWVIKHAILTQNPCFIKIA